MTRELAHPPPRFPSPLSPPFSNACKPPPPPPPFPFPISPLPNPPPPTSSFSLSSSLTPSTEKSAISHHLLLSHTNSIRPVCYNFPRPFKIPIPPLFPFSHFPFPLSYVLLLRRVIPPPCPQLECIVYYASFSGFGRIRHQGNADVPPKRTLHALRDLWNSGGPWAPRRLRKGRRREREIGRKGRDCVKGGIDGGCGGEVVGK